MEKFFPFVADIVFRASCIAYVSVLNMELNFCNDADFAHFPVIAAAPTPISLLEQSVYMQRWAPLHSKGAALPLPLQIQKWSSATAAAPIFKKERRSRYRSSEEGAPLFLPLLCCFRRLKKSKCYYFALDAAN